MNWKTINLFIFRQTPPNSVENKTPAKRCT